MSGASHAMWRLAIEALRDGVALLCPRGTLLACNRAFRELAGLGDAEPAAADGARAPLVSEAPWLAPVLTDGEASCELQVGDRWLDVRHDRLDGGSVLVLADVTAGRRTAEELRASNEMLRAIVEASPVAVLAVDNEQRVTLWNPAAERMFGWSASEITGLPYPTVVPESERASFQGMFERVIGGDGFTGVEARRQSRDGSPVHVGVSTAPLRDAKGEVVGAMAILDDLTEKKRLEERVRQVERMEAIGRLAGGVAHDFNNLLTVILSACDLLEDPRAPGDPKRLLKDIRRGAERAADLTRQLLAFSRRQVLQPARIDLNEAVREATTMLERVIGEDIRVDLQLEGAPVPVLADRGQLQRVLLNLAVNARDAMPTGGRLTIATRRLASDEARRRGLRASVAWIELSVADDGVGVAPEAMAHIFEPFFTTKGPGEGTGLGLAMVYGVVQQSGGEVAVDSTVGEGTIFRVLLPEAAPGAVASPPPPEPRAPRDVSRGTVLLVEDDAEVRLTLLELLTALGYDVLAAAGGDEALRLADAYAGVLDIVLTDVVMAGLSGRQVAEALAIRRPGIRVLFMSGYADDAVLRHGVQTAGMSFIQKPFTSRALDAQLRALLGAG